MLFMNMIVERSKVLKNCSLIKNLLKLPSCAKSASVTFKRCENLIFLGAPPLSYNLTSLTLTSKIQKCCFLGKRKWQCLNCKNSRRDKYIRWLKTSPIGIWCEISDLNYLVHLQFCIWHFRKIINRVGNTG